MSMKKGFFGAISLALLAIGVGLPVQAQSLSERELSTADSYTISEPAFSEATAEELTFDETVSSELSVQTWMPEAENLTAETLVTEPVEADAELVYPAAEETEVAQARRRRRTRSTATSPDFVGIGADIGTTDDLSFAVISKLSLSRQIAVRPSVLIGDGFAVLAPVTYEFNRFNSDVQGFQIHPYAGVGASYVDNDDESDFGLLLAGGIDVPVSQRFTVNAQANYAGVFSDSENFGVTVGVGYNFGGLIGR